MADQEIIPHINGLVDEEHALLQRGERGELGCVRNRIDAAMPANVTEEENH